MFKESVPILYVGFWLEKLRYGSQATAGEIYVYMKQIFVCLELEKADEDFKVYCKTNYYS